MISQDEFCFLGWDLTASRFSSAAKSWAMTSKFCPLSLLADIVLRGMLRLFPASP